MRFALVAVLSCAACQSASGPTPLEPPPPPLAGPTQRFAIDKFLLPSAEPAVIESGDGPDGASILPGNALGGLLDDLAAFGDFGSDGADQIRSGVLAGSIALTTGSDGQVGVSIDGAAQLRAARRAGDRVATDELQIASVPVQVPAFADADPVAIEFDALAVQLEPDGGSGYDVYLEGFVDAGSAASVAAAGLLAMVTADPADHLDLYQMIDENCDGVLGSDEVARYVGSLLSPPWAPDEVGLPSPLAAQQTLGYGFHVIPCADGSCADAPIVDRCEDRVLDGSETGVDCGGGCVPCAAGTACGSDGDCDSHACVDGACAAPTCTDHIQDGFEDGVDQGGGCGGRCT